eukprot:CAMPEP_0206434746 /NCGR_PEP_ID=MMETSP0324_2-20121206/9383_1 /ASSEMBLY_ACC=CAM_ASM_000836 /TAXON_ID=2866 /ORGANISM="Crypthecodinium cohnii, Strain Seligo" /LENGTH=98 /DNA_ID=CAMNT_0053901403 /DNA_START=532 /DNA_END=825 /DNA_ORIENTATION=+
MGKGLAVLTPDMSRFVRRYDRQGSSQFRDIDKSRQLGQGPRLHTSAPPGVDPASVGSLLEDLQKHSQIWVSNHPASTQGTLVTSKPESAYWSVFACKN